MALVREGALKRDAAVRKGKEGKSEDERSAPWVDFPPSVRNMMATSRFPSFVRGEDAPSYLYNARIKLKDFTV